ncbi:hypothetical protein [uncultured Limimaricola sp.]|uniref:hypothetical protein n=1 Tax=uncultured Limimaricola sp. TaxID=2211667 RepID=UPI0030F98771
MTMESVLRRLIGGAETTQASPAAPGGALGGALARAAQESVNLPVLPRSARRETRDREALIAELEPDALLIGLGHGAQIAGLAAIEPQLRCAVLEVLTLGAPRAAPAVPGAITGTGAAMMAPLLQRLLDRLDALDDTAPPAALRPGLRLADARAAGLLLPEISFAMYRFSMEIGPGSGREGQLMLAVPRPDVSAKAAPAADAWASALRDTVLQAPAELVAVLHRMRLPAREIEAFEPGQRLMLPGVSLGAIDLEDTQGRTVATVRLGQFAGLRAVRLSRHEVVADMSPDLPLEIPARPAGKA